MKNCIYIAIVLLWMSMSAQANNNAEPKLVYEKSAACQLFQVNDEKGLPVYYYMDINEYPCDTKECYRMDVRIYWDAWGNFLKLGFKDNAELTKINHKPFTDKDYEKLHVLLNNPESSMKYYQLHELSPEESEEEYYSVDAISGATVVDVSYESVNGAVKTCYTLWHIVYGEYVDIIQSNTKKTMAVLSTPTNLSFDHQEGIEKLLSDAQKKSPMTCSVLGSWIKSVKQLKKKNNDLYKYLSGQLAVINEESSRFLIYNFLLQEQYKDKNMRDFSLSHNLLD